MLQIHIGNQPAPLNSVNSSDWKISLGPPSMPRLIRVGYLSQLKIQDGVASVPLPEIILGKRTLRPLSSIWEIRIAGIQNSIDYLREDTIAGQEIDEFTFAHQGYHRCLRALKEVGPLVFQLPDWEAEQWFAPWQTIVEHTRSRWEEAEHLYQRKARLNLNPPRINQESDASNSPPSISATELSWDKRNKSEIIYRGPNSAEGLPDELFAHKSISTWEALRNKLGQNHTDDKNRSFERSPYPLTPWESAVAYPKPIQNQNIRYFMCRADGALEIRLQEDGASWTNRLFLVFFVTALIVSTYFWTKKSRIHLKLTSMVQRSIPVFDRLDIAHGVLFTAGLLWWLLLTPSILGFTLLIVAGLWFVRHLMRTGFKTH